MIFENDYLYLKPQPIMVVKTTAHFHLFSFQWVNDFIKEASYFIVPTDNLVFLSQYLFNERL